MGQKITLKTLNHFSQTELLLRNMCNVYQRNYVENKKLKLTWVVVEVLKNM